MHNQHSVLAMASLSEEIMHCIGLTRVSTSIWSFGFFLIQDNIQPLQMYIGVLDGSRGQTFGGIMLFITDEKQIQLPLVSCFR